jgi:hypothetical protein
MYIKRQDGCTALGIALILQYLGPVCQYMEVMGSAYKLQEIHSTSFTSVYMGLPFHKYYHFSLFSDDAPIRCKFVSLWKFMNCKNYNF